MKKCWYRELPEGFKQVYCIDAKDKKTSRRFVILDFVITLAIIIPFMLSLSANVVEKPNKNNIFVVLGFILAMVLYLVLHELVHGIVYKIETHQKLTFGMTLTVAYCGVPDLYVKRSACFYSILAPFVVFSIIFGTILLTIEHTIFWYLTAILFAVHVGGCIGDLWGAVYMATHFRDKTMFVNDTGPKQTFYVKD